MPTGGKRVPDGIVSPLPMFGGVSLPKAISARREVGIVVRCGFNIRPPDFST